MTTLTSANGTRPSLVVSTAAALTLPGTPEQTTPVQQMSPMDLRSNSSNSAPLRPLSQFVEDRIKIWELKPGQLKELDRSVKVFTLDELMKEAGVKRDEKPFVLEMLKDCRQNPGLQLLMCDETTQPFPESTCRELADINAQLKKTEVALGEVAAADGAVAAADESSCSKCIHSNAFSYSMVAITALGVLFLALITLDIIPLPSDAKTALGLFTLAITATSPIANKVSAVIQKKNDDARKNADDARKKALLEQRALLVAKQAKLNEGRLWINNAASALRIYYVDAYPVPRQAKRDDFMNRVYKPEERVRFEVQQKLIQVFAQSFVANGQAALLRNIGSCTQMKEYSVSISESNSSLDKEKSAPLLKVRDHQFQPEFLCEEFASSVALICPNPLVRTLHTTDAYTDLCRLRSVQECDLANANARAMQKDASRGNAAAKAAAVGELPDDQETQAILEQFPNSVGVIYKRLGAHKRVGSIVMGEKVEKKSDSSASDRSSDKKS